MCQLSVNCEGHEGRKTCAWRPENRSFRPRITRHYVPEHQKSYSRQFSIMLSPIQSDAWMLDPDVAFLNHGSFGACPRVVFQRQAELLAEMERESVDFLVKKLPPLLDAVREKLSQFIGADPLDVVFVQNATAGVNSVVRSLNFRPGDELLVTPHDYNACRNVIRYIAQQTGAVIVEADLPLPIESPQQILDAVLAKVTPRTRLAMLDHITSPTALIFPIEELVRELAARGVDTLVDGAHGPGMTPLDMRRIGAAYYTGNCHKWLCSPKTAGFLYVRRDRQQKIQPPVISHGWNRSRPDHTPFQDAFDWPGTFDPTPWLCIASAIEFMEQLMPGGIASLMRRNHDLAVAARRMLCERLGFVPVGPDAMLGSMAAVLLPPTDSPKADERLHDLLFDRGIEVPVYFWPASPQMILRISAQAYNEPSQYERLASVLAKIF